MRRRRLLTHRVFLMTLSLGLLLVGGGLSLHSRLSAQAPTGDAGRGSEPGAIQLQVPFTVLGPGEGPDENITPNTFGSDYFYTYVPSADFQPRDSATTYGYAGLGYIYKTAGTQLFWAPLALDAGISIGVLRIFYCDTDAANDITMYLTYYEGDTSPTFTDVASVSSSGTPGCTSTAIFFSPEHTIRTLNPSTLVPRHYVVNVDLGNATTSALRFKAVRVFWRRQISPAPGSPTFTDVPPAHPFYQHIEALVASGITTGCTATQYCPDTPLTRGQMAVFLSRALGLHWPY
ncbi:MAG: S-layer homology domain-containing protein [Acidobacteria bacterium]|nr:S-layer homology domain-containing protein [Acidobacteriota bacterium]MDW7983543.1 S-layer homology domain-containing protein [Acidobacteriota bacterium]